MSDPDMLHDRIKQCDILLDLAKKQGHKAPWMVRVVKLYADLELDLMDLVEISGMGDTQSDQYTNVRGMSDLIFRNTSGLALAIRVTLDTLTKTDNADKDNPLGEAVREITRNPDALKKMSPALDKLTLRGTLGH